MLKLQLATFAILAASTAFTFGDAKEPAPAKPQAVDAKASVRAQAPDAKAQAAPEAKTQAAPHNDASLDDLLKLPGQPKPDPSKKPEPSRPDVKKLPPMGDSEITDALVKAIAEMEEAASRLSQRQDPGLETQRMQESVLRRLDQVIAAAQQRQQQQQQQQQGQGQQQQQQQQKQEDGSKQNQEQQAKGQQQKPGQKQPGSNEPNQGQVTKGTAGEANVGGPIEETRIEWGRLPQRIRSELDQGLGEKFSPLYKRLTEMYYRRLAEEGKD